MYSLHANRGGTSMSYTVTKDFIKKETLALKSILKREGLDSLLKQPKQTKKKKVKR